MARCEDQQDLLTAFLESVGVPSELWECLMNKSEDNYGGVGILRAEESEGVRRVVAISNQAAGADIFALPHTLACTQQGLEPLLASKAELAASCRRLTGASAGSSVEEAARAVRTAWQPSDLGRHTLQYAQEFYLPHVLELCMRQAEAPNARVVALPPYVWPKSSSLGVSVLWLTAPVKAGEEVTRNWVPGMSIQRACALLTILSDRRRWMHSDEYDVLKAAMAAAAAGQLPPGFGQAPLAAPPSDKRGPPTPLGARDRVPVLYTDYPHVWLSRGYDPCVYTSVAEYLSATDDSCTDPPDVIFTTTHVRDFCSLHKDTLINQFPFEGCLIRKDLLPQTLRCIHSQSPSGSLLSATSPSNWHPDWFPATYDLQTEVHDFLADFAQREANGEDNVWLVKPAQGSHSAGMCLTADAVTVVKFRGRDAPGGDCVVQHYVRQPLLFQARKFDLRVYLLVRSFSPPDAYLCSEWYARVANKPYSSDGEEFERHFTVASYHDDALISGTQLMVCKTMVAEALAAAGITVEEVDRKLCDVARNVVSAGAQQIGSWPRSRAVYGLDFLLVSLSVDACDGPIPAEKVGVRLLEVNFGPDLTSLLRFRPGFVEEMFAVLFTEGPCLEGMMPLWQSAKVARDELDSID